MTHENDFMNDKHIARVKIREVSPGGRQSLIGKDQKKQRKDEF
jgi:hypothetical protein